MKHEVLASSIIFSYFVNAVTTVCGMIGEDFHLKQSFREGSHKHDLSLSTLSSEDTGHFYLFHHGSLEENQGEYSVEHTFLTYNPNSGKLQGENINHIPLLGTDISQVDLENIKDRESILMMFILIRLLDGREGRDTRFQNALSAYQKILADDFTDDNSQAAFEALSTITYEVFNCLDPDLSGTATLVFLLNDNGSLYENSTRLNNIFTGDSFFARCSESKFEGRYIVSEYVELDYLENTFGLENDTPMLTEIISRTAVGFMRPINSEHSIEPQDYRMRTGDYTPEELCHLAEIEDTYVMPSIVPQIANQIKNSSTLTVPLRNVLFRGDAGSGKTQAALALANLLGLPHVTMTCFPEMEVTNLTSSFIPRVDGLPTKLEAEGIVLSILETFKEDALPTLEECYHVPQASWQRITGTVKEDATESDCLNVLLEKYITKAICSSELNNQNTSDFQIIETDLVRALRHGWLIEIQEPNVINSPGVLVGLNSIMENGQLELPTGEVIKRHPNTVVVFTTNRDYYEGTGALNQSVLSRLPIKVDLEVPSRSLTRSILKKAVPDFSNDIYDLILDLYTCCNQYMKTSGAYGTLGMRDLIAFSEIVLINGSTNKAIYSAAQMSLIPSMSSDVDEQQDILATIFETQVG